MNCTNCGTSCPEGAKFCIGCGARLPVPELPVPEETVILPAASLPDEGDATGTLPEQADPILPGGSPEVSEPAPTDLPEPPVPVSHEPPAPVYQPAYPYPPAPSIPPVKPRQGSHWVPILIMAVLCVFGLTLFFALPYGTAAQSPVHSSETPWFYNDGGTLYFYEDFYTGPAELTVPDTVDGQPVTALGDYCFAYSSRITTVILPDSIQTIGECAFLECTALRGIYLPEGMTDIGAEAFSYCSALEAICIPSTVKNIGTDAFYGCLKLKYILYNGIHSHWLDLYEDIIGTRTQVYCTDGTFGQFHNSR